MILQSVDFPIFEEVETAPEIKYEGSLKNGLCNREPLRTPWDDIPGQAGRRELVPHNNGKRS